MRVGRVLLVFLLLTGTLVANENPNYPNGGFGKELVVNTTPAEKWMDKNRVSENNQPLRRGREREHSGTVSEIMGNHTISNGSAGAPEHISIIENFTTRVKSAVHHPSRTDDTRMLLLASDIPHSATVRQVNQIHSTSDKIPVSLNKFQQVNDASIESSLLQTQTNHASSPRLTSFLSLSKGKVQVKNRNNLTGISDSLLSQKHPFALFPNYPNPFNQSTTIRFTLTAPAWVTLEVFNLLGQNVRTLINRKLAAGTYTLMWDGCTITGLPVASGIYFYRLKAGGFAQIRRMILMR